MSLDQARQPVAPSAEEIARALDALHLAVNFHKPFLNTKEAAAYTGRSTKAFYEFARRHRIFRQGDGTYSRAALDRIKKQPWVAGRGRKKASLSQSQRSA
jgi:hypothetical protein